MFPLPSTTNVLLTTTKINHTEEFSKLHGTKKNPFFVVFFFVAQKLSQTNLSVFLRFLISVGNGLTQCTATRLLYWHIKHNKLGRLTLLEALLQFCQRERPRQSHSTRQQQIKTGRTTNMRDRHPLLITFNSRCTFKKLPR